MLDLLTLTNHTWFCDLDLISVAYCLQLFLLLLLVLRHKNCNTLKYSIASAGSQKAFFTNTTRCSDWIYAWQAHNITFYTMCINYVYCLIWMIFVLAFHSYFSIQAFTSSLCLPILCSLISTIDFCPFFFPFYVLNSTFVSSLLWQANSCCQMKVSLKAPLAPYLIISPDMDYEIELYPTFASWLNN